MKARGALGWRAACLLLLALGGSGVCAQALPCSPQPGLRSLTESMRAGEIARFEVVWMDPRAGSRNTIRPEDLDKRFFRKFVVTDRAPGKWQNELTDVLGKTTFSAFDPQAEGDVRWGIAFYRRGSNAAPVSIYLDGDGQTGYFAGCDYAVRGPLFDWLRRHFPGDASARPAKN